MSRIVGGTAGGRRLAVPPGETTRPTADRTREALFSSLATLLDLDGARVLDLYAGSGAVGLEALSRGAAHALLVEQDRRVLPTLRANVASLGLPGAEIRPEPVERVLAAGPGSGPGGGPPYDLVFADPPYALGADALTAVLTALVEREWLASDAVLAVERSSRGPELTWVPGVTAVRRRRYGEGTLWYGRRS